MSKSPQMSSILCVPGWIQDDTPKYQFLAAFSTLTKNKTENESKDASTSAAAPRHSVLIPMTNTDQFVLNWERKELKKLGDAMASLATETAVQYGRLLAVSVSCWHHDGISMASNTVNCI